MLNGDLAQIGDEFKIKVGGQLMDQFHEDLAAEASSAENARSTGNGDSPE